MTEPVPSATSPRRTVRVAVALVTGQAALCGLIGVLTFGPGPGSSATASRPTEARAPAVMPTASIGLPAAPMPPVPRKSSARPTAPPPRPADKPEPDRVRAESSPRRTTGRPVPPPPRRTTPPPGPKPPDVGVKPTTTPGTEFSLPVKLGDECDLEGDPGRTLSGVVVTCAKNEDGALVWQTA